MPLHRRSRLRAKAPLKRRSPLRSLSKKRQAENRRRRQVVTETFGERPQCVAPSCLRWADDVHEPLTRARGGSIVDPANMAPLCRRCHDELGDEPPWAYELGLLIHSWDAGTDRLITDLRKETP